MLIYNLELVVLVLVTAIFLVWNRKKATRIINNKSWTFMDMDYVCNGIMRNINAYILLINEDQEIIKTNYYTRTNLSQNFVPKRVGELLRCINSDTGKGCGGSDLCPSCPIRNHIVTAFAQKGEFTNLDVVLTLCDRQNSVSHANISGSYVSIQGKNCMVLTIHDITYLKKVEKDLIEAKAMVEEVSKEKSMFLIEISNEMRTALHLVSGFADLLASADSDYQKKEYLDLIRTNIDSLLKVVNDLIDSSKIESGTMKFTNSYINLNEMLDEVVDLFENNFTESSKQIEIKCEKIEKDCFINTDEKRLGQVLFNLITNAERNTDKGTITIGYKLYDTELYFFIKDTGLGIKAENLSKVFERGFQIDNEWTTEASNISLFLCKLIITKLGGKIWVESTYGEGTIFWFSLPYPGEAVINQNILIE